MKRSTDNTTDHVFGIHAVSAVLTADPGNIIDICLQDDGRSNKRLGIIAERARQACIPVRQVSSRELDRYTDGMRHQGVLARLEKPFSVTETDLDDFLDRLEEPPFLLVLDGIQDPHNLGACIRTANAAGVHAVIAPKNRASGITPVVRKVASGAVESIPFIQVTNLARVLRRLKAAGVWVIGADEKGQCSLFAADLSAAVALVLGAEGKGLRRLTREQCDNIVHIPMEGSVESLNVSVAAGICIYEALRQRMMSRENPLHKQ